MKTIEQSARNVGDSQQGVLRQREPFPNFCHHRIVVVMLKAVPLEVQHLRHHTMRGGGTSLKLPSQSLNMKTSDSSLKGNNIPGEGSVTSSHVCYNVLSKITSLQQKITRHKEIGKNREFPGDPVVRT